QKTVFEFDRIKNSKEDGCGHPSSKPVPLIAYLIQQCTQSNGLVLDGFPGSASTLIACDQLDRICYGVELEPKFVDVAVKRYYRYSQEYRKDEEPGMDIFVIRDGQKLQYDKVMTEMPESEPADDQT
ncbi:MAG: site-specific DNA-methyltransferase, partial [Oscillospiraceae bacterium]|nr:site-specific DNA-methyltransferase [Oscillospiraceae bacterium]